MTDRKSDKSVTGAYALLVLPPSQMIIMHALVNVRLFGVGANSSA